MTLTLTPALTLTLTRYETNLALFTLFNWDYGFREGPVWDFAFAQDANNTEVDYGQVLHGFVFNILHYVVVLLVFTAIVSGIIIDSFAELRAAREATRLDILHTCFVCAIEREDFETLGLDFKQHVAAQHNMWDYLFFRLYLEAKVRGRVRVRVGLGLGLGLG